MRFGGSESVSMPSGGDTTIAYTNSTGSDDGGTYISDKGSSPIKMVDDPFKKIKQDGVGIEFDSFA